MSSLADAFDAAEPGFVRWSPLLWDPIGRSAVELAAPSTGDRVLDACCGAGASAIPAAQAVGPSGVVHGVDLSERLVHTARARVGTELPQLSFEVADVTAWARPPDGPYDVVQCCFGVFFLPDMDAGTRHLVSLLRPGGRLTVTTWQHDCLTPVIGPFIRAVARQRDDAERDTPVNAASRVDSTSKLAAWLDGLGLRSVEVSVLRLSVPIDADLAWDFVTGAAARALLAGLDDRQVGAVRREYADALAADDVDTLDAEVLIGVAGTP